MSEANSFWAFMELCDMRGDLCPSGYEKVQDFIMKWYRKDSDFSRWRFNLDFELYDIEEWWKYRTPTMTELFGIFGMVVPIVSEMSQYLKTEEIPSSLLREAGK